jgi:hypothetical protein
MFTGMSMSAAKGEGGGGRAGGGAEREREATTSSIILGRQSEGDSNECAKNIGLGCACNMKVCSHPCMLGQHIL